MEEIKLNLGCGTNVLDGWINIDNSPSVPISKLPFLKEILFCLKLTSRTFYEKEWPKNVTWLNLSKGLPYPSNTVNKIYSSHLLEHLDRKQGDSLLRECFRVLRPAGIFRLVVPDLVFHANRYIQKVKGDDSLGRQPHDEFLWNIYGAYLEPRRQGASHRYMYDWPTLQIVLKETGFDQVIRQSYRISLDPEFSLLDNHAEDSLHIDAVK